MRCVQMMQHDLLLLGVSLLGLVTLGFVLYFLVCNVKEVKAPDAPAPAETNETRNRSRSGSEAELDDNPHSMSKRDILKHEKRRAKMAMKQAEDARREAKKEKDEKKMEMIREKETEKEKEFELKERQRLEREAILARDYNSWKDPYTDANCQDSFLASMIEKILLHKVVPVIVLARECNIPVVVCLRSICHLINHRMLNCLVDQSGNLYVLDHFAPGEWDIQRTKQSTILKNLAIISKADS